MASAAATNDVTLSCQPGRSGDKLIFPYVVTNGSEAEIYVMDALPHQDPQTHAWSANRAGVTVWLAADRYARVLKGIPALPPGKRVWQRVIPLAAPLAPGASMERRLELPLPLAETSPYFPDLHLREYRQQEIQGIRLIVEYLPVSAEGFGAQPVDYAPDLFRVWSRNTPVQAERLFIAFPTRQLSIMVRPDDFPRPE